MVDPVERALDVGPDRFQEGAVAGAAPVGAGEHHEQGRGVDRAVVAAEGDLAQPGHLPVADLVDDLARLGVPFRVLLLRLGGGQEAEHAAGERRIVPEVLIGGDDAVAAEDGAVPGDAGVGVEAVPGLGRHHLEVGGRAAEPVVEAFVGAVDRGDAGPPGFQGGGGALQGLGEGKRPRLVAAGFEGDREVDRLFAAGRQAQVEGGERVGQLGRSGGEGQAGAPDLAVQPLVAEDGRAASHHGVQLVPAPLPGRPPHLEDVGVVRSEADGQVDLDRQQGVVVEAKPRVPDPFPEEARGEDVDGVAGEGLAAREIRIGEIDDQRVVAPHGRAQQQGALIVEEDLEGAQEAGPLVEEPELAQAPRADGAAAVEDPEGLAVLEDARAVIGARARSQDGVRFLGLRGLLFHGSPLPFAAGRSERTLPPCARP